MANYWIVKTDADLYTFDDLVREAGFVKERQEIDPAGIFTVSVARRV